MFFFFEVQVFRALGLSIDGVGVPKACGTLGGVTSDVDHALNQSVQTYKNCTKRASHGGV